MRGLGAPVRVVACVAAIVVSAAFAGTARAAVSISFSRCGIANGGVQFTVTGTGFTGTPALELDVTTSEPGAVANPNYIVASGAVNNGVLAAAPLNADGTFTFRYESGAGQLLPAAVTVSPFDPATFVQGTVLSSTRVTAATVCADGTSLSIAKTMLPTDPSACRAGDWWTYGIYGDQGDCISYLATKGRNHPDFLP